jgi:hypothetical protein
MADPTDDLTDDDLLNELRSLGSQQPGALSIGASVLPSGGWPVGSANAGYQYFYVSDYPQSRYELRRVASDDAANSADAEANAASSDAADVGRFARRPIAGPPVPGTPPSKLRGDLAEIEDTQTPYERPSGFAGWIRDQARGSRRLTRSARDIRWVEKDTTGKLNRRQWFDDQFGEGAWAIYAPKD